MTDEANWSRLKQIIADALEAPPEERESLLRSACDGDAQLLDEATSLIRAYDASTAVIDVRTDEYLGLGGPDLLSLTGQRFGKFQLTRVIAEGAMAAVYEATQLDPQRRVALKIFRTNLTVLDAHQRFRREAQALARLVHPNIARIYEASVHVGVDRRAMPFIAMELVDGLPVTHYALRNDLSRERRIELIIKIAHAVQAAHQQAVIHRDLKPANVLVEPSGEPKVLDFGIARIVGEDLETYTWQTTAGVLLGTPGYMSPEQAAGVSHDIDVRSDVWSLGVMLHELLVNRLPIDVRSASVAEILRRIEHAQPPPISSFDPTLRGDLETIVSTALAPEKSQRYASAQSLADDLERYLRHEPISAHPPTTWYVWKKFARRNRAKLGVAGAIMFVIIVGAVVSSIAFVRASRQRDRALAANAFLQRVLTAPDASGGGRYNLTVIETLAALESEITPRFGDDPINEAEIRSTIGWTFHSLGDYQRAESQLRKAFELDRAHLGEADAKTLAGASKLITTLRWQYKADEAQKLCDALVPLAAKQLGELDPVTLSLRDNQAGIAYEKGDLERAENLFTPLVAQCHDAVQRGLIPADDAIPTGVMDNLANVYLQQGRNAQAETILREVIKTREAHQGTKTLAQIVARSNLGNALIGQGQVTEAENLLRRVVEDATKVLGNDNDNTLAARAALASVLETVGRFDDALPLRRDILERLKRVYGPESGGTIQAMHNFAVTLLNVQRAAEAAPILKVATDAAARVWGENSPPHLQVRRAYADALHEVGKTEQAEKEFLALIEIIKHKLPADDPQIVIPTNNLALLMIETNRAAQAEPMLRQALDIVQKHGHAGASIVRRNLGYCLTKLARFDAAEKELLASVEMLKSSPNPHANDRNAERLVELYTAWNKPDAAKKWRSTTQP